ncbi:MAG: hypothetical protein J6A16_04305 [Oscillospiraceae bacterium]|nr:hypothetical protein [Oscillospiraceae bacterium]
MKKRLLSIALISLLLISAAGCASKPAENAGTTVNEEPAASTESIKANEGGISVPKFNEKTEATTASTAKPAEPVVVSDGKLVPDCPVNVSADIPLQEFYVIKPWEEFNDATEDYYNRFNVTNCYIKDVLESNTDVIDRSNGFNNTLRNDCDFKFVGEWFEGLYMEAVFNGKLVDGSGRYDEQYNVVGRIEEDELIEMPIKAVADSCEQIHDFYGLIDRYLIEFYDCISIGSTREDVEAILGKGHLGTHPEYTTVMYNNGTATMVIHYETVDKVISFDDEKTYDTVHSIYLISNK